MPALPALLAASRLCQHARHAAPQVAELGVPYVLMHMRGTPQDMQQRQHTAYADVVADVAAELASAARRAMEAGIEPWRLVLDPGLGFAKTQRGNLQLMAQVGMRLSARLLTLSQLCMHRCSDAAARRQLGGPERERQRQGEHLPASRRCLLPASLHMRLAWVHRSWLSALRHWPLLQLPALRAALPAPLRRLPLLLGPSRKGFLGKLTGRERAADRDFATAAAAALCVAGGASIIRAHNVEAVRDAVRVADAVRPFLDPTFS